MSCKRCGSMAINDHCHGRIKGSHLDLCDVCYWRGIAESLGYAIEEIKEDIWEHAFDHLDEKIYYKFSGSKIGILNKEGYFASKEGLKIAIPILDVSSVEPELLLKIANDYAKRNKELKAMDL